MMARILELPVDYTKLTQSQRREVRLQYTTRQNGKCSHCMEPLESQQLRYRKRYHGE